MVWSEATRGEIEHVLRKIPLLSWKSVEPLFREEDRFDGDTYPDRFGAVPDPDDRKFAALAEATEAVLITSDTHLLGARESVGAAVLTPGEFLERD